MEYEQFIQSKLSKIKDSGFQAVKMNRRGIGIELKESYYDIAVKNIESVSREQSLFKKKLELFMSHLV